MHVAHCSYPREFTLEVCHSALAPRILMSSPLQSADDLHWLRKSGLHRMWYEKGTPQKQKAERSARLLGHIQFGLRGTSTGSSIEALVA